MSKIGTKMLTQKRSPWREKARFGQRLRPAGCLQAAAQIMAQKGSTAAAAALEQCRASGIITPGAIPGTTDPRRCSRAGRPTTCRLRRRHPGVAVVRPGAAVFGRDPQEPPAHPARAWAPWKSWSMASRRAPSARRLRRPVRAQDARPAGADRQPLGHGVRPRGHGLGQRHR